MDKQKVSNYLFIGFILVGTALGLYIRKPAVGAVLGVGIGFLVKAIYLQRKN
jgi:hypothetical protein